MPVAEMNHRERIRAAIERRPLDRVPTDIWATPEVVDRLKDTFGCSTFVDTWNYLHIDGIVNIAPDYVGPKLPDLGPHRMVNEWGMGSVWQDYERGGYWEQDVYPLAHAQTIADIDAFPWPQPAWYDYSVLRDKAAQHPDRAIMYGYVAVFYYHNKLRGLELSLMDLVLRPEFTRHLVRRIGETFLALHQAGFEAAGKVVDVTQVTDDFGSQQGLLISRRMFTEVYRPWMEQAIQLARSYGIKVFHHDDGAIREIIPDLLQMGIDVLNPIQWRCTGMERDGLARDFGEQLCFHGGVDNQQTLPFGTVEDVQEEVETNLKTLGDKGTGYILAPCHNIQPNTPTQNIIAMYETAYRLGNLAATAKPTTTR